MDHYSYSMSQRASKTLIYIKLFLQFTRYFVIVIGLSLVGPNLLVHLRGFPLFQCRQEQYLHSVFIQLLFIWLSLLQSNHGSSFGRFKKHISEPRKFDHTFSHSFIYMKATQYSKTLFTIFRLLGYPKKYSNPTSKQFL